jgi:hypothetical protein
MVTRGSGKVSEEFWEMPRPKDPEGLFEGSFGGPHRRPLIAFEVLG